MRFFAVLAMLVCVCECLSEESNFDIASDYLDKKDSANALVYMEKAANEDNDRRAAYVAGIMYMSGDGTPKNYEKAVRYLKDASVPYHDPYALFWVACMYSTGGCGLDADPHSAKVFLEMAASVNETELEHSVGPLCAELARTLLKSKKYPEFMKLALSVTTNFYIPGAALLLGIIYHDGAYGIPRDYVKAFKYLKIAAEKGDDSALMLVADAYAMGHGVEKDLSEAEDIYKELLEKPSCLWAECRLGVMYYKNGRKEEGEKILLKLFDSDDIPNVNAKNFLAYEWARENRNLDRAESIIKEVLKKEPDETAYIDTYGYILLKKGRNKEALELFLKAEKDRSPEVISHVGDAYFALGEKEKARNYWSESLKLMENDSELKKEISDKLDSLNH